MDGGDLGPLPGEPAGPPARARAGTRTRPASAAAGPHPAPHTHTPPRPGPPTHPPTPDPRARLPPQKGITGEGYDFNPLLVSAGHRDGLRWAPYVVTVAFMAVMSLVLVNLVIAMMSRTFRNVSMMSEEAWLMQWATVVLQMESFLPLRLRWVRPRGGRPAAGPRRGAGFLVPVGATPEGPPAHHGAPPPAPPAGSGAGWATPTRTGRASCTTW